MMKTSLIAIVFILLFSCSTNEKKQIASTVYIANCKGEYSTGEQLSKKDKAWSLNKSQIDKIMSLSNPITESEWHFSFPNTPCNIDVKNYLYKGKNYDLQINGGSYVSLFDGKTTTLLGCELPECEKYFLKAMESMEEEIKSPLSTNSSEQTIQIKNYNVNLNKNNIPDLLIIKKNKDSYDLEAKIDNKIFLNKNFSCDFIEIETETKNNQAFNLTLGYTDQYQKLFRKIVIPVFYHNNTLYIEKIFIATLGISAETSNEEWTRKEISKKVSLKELNVDNILSE